MLVVLLVLLCCLASSTFAWMPTKARNSNVNSITMSSSASDRSRSKSIPFLIQPKALDGSLAGDEGFDPLGKQRLSVSLSHKHIHHQYRYRTSTSITIIIIIIIIIMIVIIIIRFIINSRCRS